MTNTQVVVPVQGMTCASCVAHVSKALSGVEGVADANVNLATERASVTFDSELVDLGNLADAVQMTGYESPTETMILPIGGMTCASCADHVEKALSKVPGVTAVNANMDTLIALGTGVSLLTGPASFLFPVANYAGVSAMIMAFHLTGRYVEETAKGRASQAIRKLLELGAKTARVLKDGIEVEIPIERVQTGDLMVIRPGEKGVPHTSPDHTGGLRLAIEPRALSTEKSERWKGAAIPRQMAYVGMHHSALLAIS